MTDKELQEIKERLSQTTPGQWRYNEMEECIESDIGQEVISVGVDICDEGHLEMSGEDMNFILNARQDMSQLIKEIERLRELNKWIPVEDKLPEFDSNCLVTTERGEIFTSKFYGYGEESQGSKEFPDGVWEIDACEETVIAWQELPEPPKEGKQ